MERGRLKELALRLESDCLESLEKQNRISTSQSLTHSENCLQADNADVEKIASFQFYFKEHSRLKLSLKTFLRNIYEIHATNA